MQRYNIFNMIHKALRALLYDTALTLQQTYFGNVDEAKTALRKVEAVLHQFEQHTRHENQFILPLITAYEPRLVEAFEKEHEEDQRIGDQLKHLVNIFHATTLEDEKVVAGSGVAKAFMDFMIFNLEHMAKEERVLNPVLWAYYTDIQLLQMNARLVASIPAPDKAVSSKWVMRGISNREAIMWLKAVKHTASRPEFQAILSLTDTELPVHRRIEIKEAVLEEEGVLIY
jgi:hemerythrin-like domain-containing protein